MHKPIPPRLLLHPLLRKPLPTAIPRQRLSHTYSTSFPPAHRPPATHRPPHPHLHSNAIRRSQKSAEARRQFLLVTGAVLSMIGLWTAATWSPILTEAPPPPVSGGGGGGGNARPSIKPGVPVPIGVLSEAEKAAGVELIPSGTSSVPDFPKTLVLDIATTTTTGEEEEGEYVLIGLGIRTVSFLSIQVYVVGFYIHLDDLAAVQAGLLKKVHPLATAATQVEREGLKKMLMDPREGEGFFNELLDVGKSSSPGGLGFRSVFRIVPTRNTDYQHLRDGWVRGIQSRSTKSPVYDDEAFGETMTQFKQFFGGFKKSVPKQKVLLLTRDSKGGLKCIYDGSGRNDGKLGSRKEEDGDGEGLVVLGSVDDERLSRALWLCYLAGEKVASEPARLSIIEGLLDLVERPIGTVGSATVGV